jgi:hypothetical protein
MMTEMEKFRMYQEKERFIRKLDLILTTPKPKGMSVEGVEYELWTRKTDELTMYQEVIVITFIGGGTLPLSANGISNSANLRVIAENIDGGEYSFVPTYMKIKDLWTKVDLD